MLETARGDEAAQAVAATLPEPVRASLDRLEKAGRAYYEFRASLMVKNNEGLTKTYNRFHDPGHDGTGINGRAPADVVADIKKLRALHAEMDRAVLDAYGWGDIPTACEFLLDYEEDEDDDDEGAFRRRQKPWRYRWPDEVRDEVLARLLKLNADRAAEERRKGLTAGPKRPPASSDDDSPPADLDPAPKRGRKKKSSASHATLPGLSPANEDSEP
ncbi:MAG: putative restriction /modification enzyme [Candidatus Ozemobacter sibiricus]|uniref:Putative restriction /modification enzyme n=1 Tax=Candidatus Ozemobacter sibiricus TaxID=2268124 RepID=A0A367ZRC8_9BACT|nr:MAG: putative restriction /modification enzyme [Candidatus Ozemobacter sibiricus]